LTRSIRYLERSPDSPYRIGFMIGRVLFYGLFLVAVGVLPYFSSEWLKASRAPPTGDAANTADAAASQPVITAAPLVVPAGAASRSSETPIVELAEAIRFEATVTWLFQRWPRVTAGLPEGHLQGYRVNLITGVHHDDVAGSLTYYFNADQRCQRISLQGSVGDPRKLVAYIVGRYGLIRQNSPDPAVQLYQTRWNGRQVSELTVRPVAVVKSSEPFSRYDVQLVLTSWSRN
jgi:uncharacterized protein DUF6690